VVRAPDDREVSCHFSALLRGLTKETAMLPSTFSRQFLSQHMARH